ncbi:hypothetical protein CASFOL_024132 [Castilleja foliolosa]|uniref:Uncharacterized protein n=1 Tax=Castilleja foliolosa TaxID=1961234 RepID=A0ABD3CMF5_9LAMI
MAQPPQNRAPNKGPNETYLSDTTRIASLEAMMNNVMGEIASMRTMIGQLATTVNKISSEKDKLPSQSEQAMAVHVLRSGKRVENGVEYRDNEPKNAGKSEKNAPPALSSMGIDGSNPSIPTHRFPSIPLQKGPQNFHRWVSMGPTHRFPSIPLQSSPQESHRWKSMGLTHRFPSIQTQRQPEPLHRWVSMGQTYRSPSIPRRISFTELKNVMFQVRFVRVGDRQANLWLWFEPYLYETII